MTKGKLTPLALAIGFALCGTAFAGQNSNAFIDDNKTFDKTETIESDKATVVGSGVGVGSYPITLQIAPDAELTLINTNTGNALAPVVSLGAKDITFTGGKLILHRDEEWIGRDDNHYSPNYGNPGYSTIIQAAYPATLTFDTSDTVIEGTEYNGIFAHKNANIIFTNGFTLNIDRSQMTTDRDVTGIILQQEGTVTTTSADIHLTAGDNDVGLTGVFAGYGGNFSANRLNMELNGRNVSTLQALYGLYSIDAQGYPIGNEITIAGPTTITLQDAPKGNSYALALISERNHSFAGKTQITVKNSAKGYGLYSNQKVDFADDLQMDFSGNENAWGVVAYGNSKVAAKAVSLNMRDGGNYAIWLKDSAQTTIDESLTTNADYAAFGQNNSIVDVKKNFVTTAESSLVAENDAQIRINSSGAGKVQFSGFTEITDNGQISLTIGSGAAGEDSYWNVTDFSALTGLTVAANASLNFLLTPELLGNLAADGAIVTVTGAPVLLHSATQGASTITLSGIGLALNAGDEVRLINSEKGIALDEVNNLLAAGDSLDELKGDLKVEHIASLSRVQESDLTKDDYDLSMKTDELLIATIKEKAPAPTPDPDPDPVPEPDRPSSDKVNDQTNALMQSSIAAAATMFAADELLIDTTMKSRQGVRQTGPFAAARVGRYDLDVRGDLETNVISGLLGYAVNLQGSEIGAFVEMGHGTYDTKTTVTVPVGETKGDSKHNYVGFGVYGNYATPIDWLHVTGYVKGGWLRNEFSAPIAGVSVDFDRTSNYWGAHLGMYGEFQAAGKIKNRTFLNYFYDGRESESYSASGSSDVAGADFHFNSLNSHRAQLGSVFEYAYTSALRPYAALTYEYAFKADARGRATDQFGDLALNGTDLEGSTGIVSLGWTYQNEAKRFEFDLGVNGYTGKRQGVSAQLQAAWKF